MKTRPARHRIPSRKLADSLSSSPVISHHTHSARRNSSAQVVPNFEARADRAARRAARNTSTKDPPRSPPSPQRRRKHTPRPNYAINYSPSQPSIEDSLFRLSSDESDLDDANQNPRPIIPLQLRLRPASFTFKIRVQPPLALTTQPPRRARSQSLQHTTHDVVGDTAADTATTDVGLGLEVLPSLRLWNDAEARLVQNPVPLDEIATTLERNHTLAQYVGQDESRFPACFAGEMMSDEDVVRWSQEIRKPGKDRRLLLIDPVEVSFVPYERSESVANVDCIVRNFLKEVPLRERKRVFQGRFTDYQGLPKGMETYVMDCMKHLMKKNVSDSTNRRQLLKTESSITNPSHDTNEQGHPAAIDHPWSSPKRPHDQLEDLTDELSTERQNSRYGAMSKNDSARLKRRRYHDDSLGRVKNGGSISPFRGGRSSFVQLSQPEMEEEEGTLSSDKRIWQDIFGSDAESESFQEDEELRHRPLESLAYPPKSPSSHDPIDVAHCPVLDFPLSLHTATESSARPPRRRWTIAEVSDSEDSLFGDISASILRDSTTMSDSHNMEMCNGGGTQYQPHLSAKPEQMNSASLPRRGANAGDDNFVLEDDARQSKQKTRGQTLPSLLAGNINMDESDDTEVFSGKEIKHRSQPMAESKVMTSVATSRKRKGCEYDNTTAEGLVQEEEPRACAQVEQLQEHLPRKGRKLNATQAALSQSKRNLTNPVGIDNYPLESAPYSSCVYIWNYKERKRSSTMFPVREAISLCRRGTYIGIYDGQDFDFKNREFALTPKMFDYDHAKWRKRDEQSPKGKVRVRVWDPIQRGIRRFQYCPTIPHLEDWLKIHADYAVFEPSMLNMSCCPISDDKKTRGQPVAEPSFGVTPSLPLRLYLSARVRDMKYANLKSKTTVDYTFWNALKECMERRRPFENTAQMLNFWLATPWLEIYRGQDKIEDFESQTGLSLIPILTTCPAKLASFWDRKALREHIRPEHDRMFEDKTIYQCLVEYPNLELYLGQGTPCAEYLSKSIEHSRIQGQFPYCYMLGHCGSLGRQFFNLGWVALYLDPRKLSTACAVFWNKKSKSLEMQPEMTSFISIADYLQRNSDTMELYVGQDLKDEAQIDISNWFQLLTFRPGYSATDEVPLLTKRLFLPRKLSSRVINSHDLLSATQRKRATTNTQRANTALHGTEVKGSTEQNGETLKSRDALLGRAKFSNETEDTVNLSMTKQDAIREEPIINFRVSRGKPLEKERKRAIASAGAIESQQNNLIVSLKKKDKNSRRVTKRGRTYNSAKNDSLRPNLLDFSRQDIEEKVVFENDSVALETKQCGGELIFKAGGSDIISQVEAPRESNMGNGVQGTSLYGIATPKKESHERSLKKMCKEAQPVTSNETVVQRESANDTIRSPSENLEETRRGASHCTAERRESSTPITLKVNSNQPFAKQQGGSESSKGDLGGASCAPIPVSTENEDHRLKSIRHRPGPMAADVEAIACDRDSTGCENNTRPPLDVSEEAKRSTVDDGTLWEAPTASLAHKDFGGVRDEHETDSGKHPTFSQQNEKGSIKLHEEAGSKTVEERGRCHKLDVSSRSVGIEILPECKRGHENEVCENGIYHKAAPLHEQNSSQGSQSRLESKLNAQSENVRALTSTSNVVLNESSEGKGSELACATADVDAEPRESFSAPTAQGSVSFENARLQDSELEPNLNPHMQGGRDQITVSQDLSEEKDLTTEHAITNIGADPKGPTGSVAERAASMARMCQRDRGRDSKSRSYEEGEIRGMTISNKNSTLSDKKGTAHELAVADIAAELKGHVIASTLEGAAPSSLTASLTGLQRMPLQENGAALECASVVADAEWKRHVAASAAEEAASAVRLHPLANESELNSSVLKDDTREASIALKKDSSNRLHKKNDSVVRYARASADVRQKESAFKPLNATDFLFLKDEHQPKEQSAAARNLTPKEPSHLLTRNEKGSTLVTVTRKERRTKRLLADSGDSKMLDRSTPGIFVQKQQDSRASAERCTDDVSSSLTENGRSVGGDHVAAERFSVNELAQCSRENETSPGELSSLESKRGIIRRRRADSEDPKELKEDVPQLKDIDTNCQGLMKARGQCTGSEWNKEQNRMKGVSEEITLRLSDHSLIDFGKLSTLSRQDKEQENTGITEVVQGLVEPSGVMEHTKPSISKPAKTALLRREREILPDDRTKVGQERDGTAHNVLRGHQLVSKSQTDDAKRTALEASLDTTNCSEEQPSVGTPGPSTRTPGSSTAEQPDENIESDDNSMGSDDIEPQAMDINNSGDALTESRLLKARKEAIKMANLIRSAGPKILNRQLAQDVRQSLREEMLLEVGNSRALITLAKRLYSPDFLIAAEDLCGRLEVLDTTGCFSGTTDYEYGPSDLASIREDLMLGRIFTICGVIEKFRLMCGDLLQFYEGSVLYFEAALLKHNGEEVIHAFISENRKLVCEERQVTRVGSICQKAEKIGFREEDSRKGLNSTDTKSPGTGKPTIRVSGYQSEVTFLNYRDEKGNSVMGKRHSARVLGLSIDRKSCEKKIGNVRPCHVCKKAVFKSTGDSLQCVNHAVGLCDVIVCRECLVVVFSMKEPDFISRRQANDWICIDCKGFCQNEFGGSSRCERKNGKAADVEVLLTWLDEGGLSARSMGLKLLRRSLSGNFPAWKYSKACKLSKASGKWSKRTRLQPGVYRCRVEVNEKWTASTVVHVFSEERRRKDVESDISLRAGANGIGGASCVIGRQGLVVSWSLSKEASKGPVHSFSKNDGGRLIKECSRTEGYDWRRSKHHSVVRWVPNWETQKRQTTTVENGLVGAGDETGSKGEVDGVQVARMCSSCVLSPCTVEQKDFPRLRTGMLYKAFRRAVVACKFDYMFNETLRGIVMGKSDIHGIGLFTLTGYQRGDFVIEYAGDLIRSPLADIREKRYDAAGLGTYLFRIDDYKIVDATVNSNRARFTNHSCDPNMEADIVNVRGRDLVVLLATRDIPPFSELTFNYQLPYEDKKLQCLCNSWNCIGIMN